MKLIRRFLMLGMSLCFAASLSGCAAPRYVWPQDDIRAFELNDPQLERKVLIASRSSEFKDAMVERIRQAFAEEPVYIKFIGLDGLGGEDGGRYAAVVIINTCMAWGLDRHVEAFLDRQERHAAIIVLTTAGDAKWMPDKKSRDYDAITTASLKTDVQRVADEVVAKVRALLAAA